MISSIVEGLSIGTSVKITGPILPSPGPDQPIELQASALEVLGQCNPEVCTVGYRQDPSIAADSELGI